MGQEGGAYAQLAKPVPSAMVVQVPFGDYTVVLPESCRLAAMVPSTTLGLPSSSTWPACRCRAQPHYTLRLTVHRALYYMLSGVHVRA
jgi:hypothetical protein